MDTFAGKRVTVMGLGRFGGGVGVTRWLADQGARVLVTDRADEASLADSVAAVRGLLESGSVSLRLGAHREEDFAGADLVVANPAVPRPWENEFLRAAWDAGVGVTTEIELLVHRLPDRSRTIGVTGSVGKSTTAAMIAHILNGVGERAHLGGNIGGSLLPSLGRIEARDWVVLELSSAMLHWIDAWSPRIAVMTNLRPNHLDWHGTAEHYARSKARLFAWQESSDAAVFGDDPVEVTTPDGVRVRVVGDPGADGRTAGLRVIGRHNRINAAVAVAACAEAGVDEDLAWRSAASFAGLPHRLEFVGSVGGVQFYNDSKSTSPAATVTALSAFEGEGPGGGLGRIHLIAGGYDKGLDLSEMAGRAAACAGLYTIGQTGPRLEGHPERTLHCGTLDRAFAEAASRAVEGDTVLLSPGCASWDQYENFERRGEAFAQLVNAHSRAAGAEVRA